MSLLQGCSFRLGIKPVRYLLGALIAGAAIAAVASPLDVGSQHKARDAVGLRKANMEMIQFRAGELGAMIKKKMPFNAKRFAAAAERLATVTRWAGEGFAVEHMTSDSEASPGIWKDKARFDKLMVAMAEKAEDFRVVAVKAAGNGQIDDASRKAFKALTNTCGDCHKPFKD